MVNIIGQFITNNARVKPFVASDWPNASTTGVTPGTILTPSGDITTSADNQVIQNLNLTGIIFLEHNNVIIRNCRINMNDVFGITSSGAIRTGSLIDHCEIIGQGGEQGGISCDGQNNLEIRYCNIHGQENGINIASDGMYIHDNYIHDLSGGTDADPHIDGIQGAGGFTGLTIRHNAIWSTDTSCIILQDEAAGFSNVLIEHNLCEIGTGAASIYCQNKPVGGSGGLISNITIINNHLTKGVVYTVISTATIVNLTFTGNVDADTGAGLAPDT